MQQPKEASKKSPLFSYFLSQPHQPFFLTGIVWAVLAMLFFTAGYRGILPFTIDTTFFHAYSMIYIVISHFFHGFLLTTFPRFCMSAPVPRQIYLKLFGIYETGGVLFFIGALFYAPAALAGTALILAGHALVVSNFRQIYLAGGSPEKRDPFWLLIAHLTGLAVHLLFVAALALDLLGIDLQWQNGLYSGGFYLYLIFLTFTVAQRMIPFFSHVMADKPTYFLPLVYAALALKTIFIAVGSDLMDAAVTLVLALYLLKEFLGWKLPVFSSPAILWILHMGLFWLPAALLIDAVTTLARVWMQTSFVFGGMHLAAIGFMVTILIGFGTRVTLGHSGQVPHADRLTIALFWFTEAVVLARFSYSLAMGLGLDLQWLFDLSAAMWIVLFCVWGARFGPILFRGKKGG
ncbi:NnrS protein [Hydrogenimonas sp.]|nr:NnrS protein [Hydrogenimonas sp.]